METPKAETPKAGTPKAETPKAETPKAVTQKAVTQKAGTQKAGTPMVASLEKGPAEKATAAKNPEVAKDKTLVLAVLRQPGVAATEKARPLRKMRAQGQVQLTAGKVATNRKNRPWKMRQTLRTWQSND